MNGQASGPVLQSVFLVVLAHSGTPMLEIQIVNTSGILYLENSSVTQLNGIFVSCMPMSFRFEQFANYNSKTSGPFSFQGPLGKELQGDLTMRKKVRFTKIKTIRFHVCLMKLWLNSVMTRNIYMTFAGA